ncbi:MAG: CopG family transcriptional regulator [Gaiellaceae bacterium]
MIRTQIHLDRELVDLVDREAARSGASRAEVIRRTLRDRFAKPADEPYAIRLDRALESAFGAWKDRRFESGEEYIRALRSGDWDLIDG